MGFNLENEKIQDTYEQLVQVSGSILVDGTGSLISVTVSSASFAEFSMTASFALNAGNIDTSSLVTTSSFNAYTASNDASVASKVATSTFNAYTSSNNSVVNALVAATSSYVSVGNDVSLLINDANYAIATNISGAFNSTSSSLSSRITTNTSNISTQTSRVDSLVAVTSSYALKTQVSGAFTSTSASIATDIATNKINIGTLTSQTSSYARTNVNNNFSGTQNFVNIAVSGTASIGHVQTITGSAVIIGDEFIILNASTPAARYAGLVVFDSGSTPATASFEWDGLTDNWIIMEETGNTAVLLTGPTGSRGAEVLPTVDRLQKGGGHHQLMDSNITDNGTLVSVSTPLTATQITASSGFKGDLDGNAETATSALTASLAFFADTSSFAVTTISASHAETSSFANVFNVDTLLKVGNVIRGGNFNTNSSGNRNIVFGQNNLMQAVESILLGGEENIMGVNANYCGIYSAASSQISNGDTSIILGGYLNQINGGLRSIIIGGTSVINSQDLSVTLGKFNFTARNPNTTYVDNFESTGSLNHSGSVQIVGSITSSLGFSGDGSGLTNVSAVFATSASFATTSSHALNVGLSDGSGLNSIASTLTTTPAIASGISSLAIGNGAKANSEDAVSIGNEAQDSDANRPGSIQIGFSTAAAQYGVGIGYNAEGNGEGAVGLGWDARGNSNQAIAIGKNATVQGAENGIAIGHNSDVDAQNAIAIGFGAAAISANEINIGNRFKFDGSSVLTLSSSIVSSSANIEVGGQIYSPVFSGSVASSTASFNFDNGNFAVITLTSPTHIENPSNLKSGTTYTLIINSGSLVTTYGSAFKFAGGVLPILSNGLNMITMVSDGSRLLASSLDDFS